MYCLLTEHMIPYLCAIDIREEENQICQSWYFSAILPQQIVLEYDVVSF